MSLKPFIFYGMSLKPFNFFTLGYLNFVNLINIGIPRISLLNLLKDFQGYGYRKTFRRIFSVCGIFFSFFLKTYNATQTGFDTLLFSVIFA